VVAALEGFEPRSAAEAADVARIRTLAGAGDPWDRSSRLHVTASAIVVDPGAGRVLLRWHERMQGWLQVGGHGDPGETDPLAVALREAREETGLADLTPWPGPDGSPDRSPAPALPLHVVIVPVPAARGEPDHEHADVRYLLATGRPEAARAESPGAPVRWLALDEAGAAVGQDNLAVTLERVAEVLG
jgi:8-oxo-dGTP pyrophosphatase MutT (NUDIX family)